jgi:hypothetical protein
VRLRRIPSPGANSPPIRSRGDESSAPEIVSTTTPVESVCHHNYILGKWLVLDSTNRKPHFLSRFENVMAHNVGRNEGNLGTVRAVNNPKPLRVDFLDDSYHFVGSPLSLQRLPAHLFEQGTSLFVVLSRSLPPVACF